MLGGIDQPNCWWLIAGWRRVPVQRLQRVERETFRYAAALRACFLTMANGWPHDGQRLESGHPCRCSTSKKGLKFSPGLAVQLETDSRYLW
jgi:hypothetical protein